MVFSSLIFLYAFFPLSLLCYLLCQNRTSKNIILLIFSLVFYAWGEPVYVLLLMFMALTSWFCALRISRTDDKKLRKTWVAVSCVIDIALIGFFKYASLICGIFGPVPELIARIALPIGISFYTFQLLTYVVDVYRGEAEAQDSYLNVLLYAALFHQCIAGPIVRYKTVADELFGESERTHEWLPGISRFSVGLAKKALLANPCGALADSLLLTDKAIADISLFSQNFAELSSQTVLGLWLGVIAYGLQIYLDFSAYSDMAIGMGRMIGLHYLENFNFPYISRSVTEFWRRWHISLGTFFRDYVYIPLGGNRCSHSRFIFNTFAVWALTGLWHGASWNFVLWGLWFFVFMMLEKAFLGKALKKLPVLSNIYLLFVVALGWVIFRFTNMELGGTVFLGLFGMNGNSFSDFFTVIMLKNHIFLLLCCFVACTPLVKLAGNFISERARSASPALCKVWDIIRWAVIPTVLLLLSTAALVGNSYNPFIYFQF